jgi:hypothetical protein
MNADFDFARIVGLTLGHPEHLSDVIAVRAPT